MKTFIYMAACTILFTSSSAVLTILFLNFQNSLFSKIWLFNAVVSNIVVNIALLVLLLIVSAKLASYSEITPHLIYASIIATLLHVAWLGIVIVSYDRSISIYFLSSMSAQSSPQSKEQLDEMLWSGYFQGHSATQQRIDEQTTIGNMERLNDGRYTLSAKGHSFIELSRKIATLYKVRRDFLWPTTPSDIDEN